MSASPCECACGYKPQIRGQGNEKALQEHLQDAVNIAKGCRRVEPSATCGVFVRVQLHNLAGDMLFDEDVSIRLGNAGIRAAMRAQGLNAGSNVQLVLDGKTIEDDPQRWTLGQDGQVSLTYVEEEPPPPPVAVYARERVRAPIRYGECDPPCNGSECCNCLAADCELVVLENGMEVRTLMSDLQVGALVQTGSAMDNCRYRRVMRIWSSHVAQQIEVVELSPGCRLTANHPVLVSRQWLTAKEAAAHYAGSSCKESFEKCVYGLELEGHVDTVNVAGVTCAGIGVYCGERFGWNVFTRKSMHCDVDRCASCKIAVDTTLDFSNVQSKDLEVRYEPYWTAHGA